MAFPLFDFAFLSEAGAVIATLIEGARVLVDVRVGWSGVELAALLTLALGQAQPEIANGGLEQLIVGQRFNAVADLL